MCLLYIYIYNAHVYVLTYTYIYMYIYNMYNIHKTSLEEINKIDCLWRRDLGGWRIRIEGRAFCGLLILSHVIILPIQFFF